MRGLDAKYSIIGCVNSLNILQIYMQDKILSKLTAVEGPGSPLQDLEREGSDDIGLPRDHASPLHDFGADGSDQLSPR